ncbi:fungal-specific transcription factor domain-containing protein, partial [Elsinoe ampelina]
SGLLGTFYRLSLPSTTARFSGEDLLDYYFTEVCPLYSCFDGECNPFRTIVRELWKTSATVYLPIQSMAVATISNHYLYMAPIGHAKKSQAWKSLQLDLRLHRAGKLSLETVLMGLLLLGLSSPWHRPADLGLKHLFIARNLVQNYLRGDGTHVPMKHEAFFMDALMYWEMLASFVDPVPLMTFPGFGAPTPQIHKDDTQVYPHPWTGVQPKVHFAIAEIGRLLRRRRRQQAALVKTPPGPGQKDWCQDDESWAVDLERYLKNIHIPGVANIAEYDDEETPKLDLVKTAQANRLMGLLELYAAFSQRLEKELSTDSNFSASFGDDFTTSLDHTSYCSIVESWLCTMALHTLHHLQDIAISSSACRSHPLVL